MLPTDPPMTVVDVFDVMDGVYSVIKDKNSVFLWVNDNFARLVGRKKEDLIGHKDDQEAHVAHDKEVMASGIPLLNFNETIIVPAPDGGTQKIEIVTQKGLLRKKGGSEIIGITVCFSLKFPEKNAG
jgi:PAS domain-containing protein